MALTKQLSYPDGSSSEAYIHLNHYAPQCRDEVVTVQLFAYWDKAARDAKLQPKAVFDHSFAADHWTALKDQGRAALYAAIAAEAQVLADAAAAEGAEVAPLSERSIGHLAGATNC